MSFGGLRKNKPRGSSHDWLTSPILSHFPNWFLPCIARYAMTIRFLWFLVYNSRQERNMKNNESIRNQIDRSLGLMERSSGRRILFAADGLTPRRGMAWLCRDAVIFACIRKCGVLFSSGYYRWKPKLKFVKWN